MKQRAVKPYVVVEDVLYVALSLSCKPQAFLFIGKGLSALLPRAVSGSSTSLPTCSAIVHCLNGKITWLANVTAKKAHFQYPRTENNFVNFCWVYNKAGLHHFALFPIQSPTKAA